jgi:4-amino-4-deoxychorismate lyase
VSGALLTPAITDAGVRGATRDRILAACAAAGRDCRESTLTAADLQDAEELFVCNSAMEIWPLRSLAQRGYPHGPVTRWCRRQLEASA